MVNINRILENFKSMVALDSPSHNERLVCEYLKKYLKSIGVDAIEDDAGEKSNGTTGNIYAYIDGDCSLEPLLFSAHMDTVEPSHNKRAVIHEDGTITSEGNTVLGSDDIAGLVSILEALTVIIENKMTHRPIEILFTVSEETHCGGSTCFDYSRLKSNQAYVFDLDGEIGTAASSAPTILTYEAEFIGKAAHAGFAYKDGIHAIKAASKAVTELPCGEAGEGVTTNVGVISGGKATNIVPDSCKIRGEIRSFNDARTIEKYNEYEAICKAAADEFGAGLNMTYKKEITAFNTGENSDAVKRFKACCDNLGLKGECSKTFGGSDCNVFAAHGVNGLVLATGMNNCHAVNEYTSVSQLETAAKLALELMLSED